MFRHFDCSVHDAIHCSQRRILEPELPGIDGPNGLNLAGWVKKLSGLPLRVLEHDHVGRTESMDALRLHSESPGIVSRAPSSATKMASSRAGSVALAFSLTR